MQVQHNFTVKFCYFPAHKSMGYLLFPLLGTKRVGYAFYKIKGVGTLFIPNPNPDLDPNPGGTVNPKVSIL